MSWETPISSPIKVHNHDRLVSTLLDIRNRIEDLDQRINRRMTEAENRIVQMQGARERSCTSQAGR